MTFEADENPHSDLLSAYDLLMAELAASPDDASLKHRAVLMLARSGAIEHAQREFTRLGLDGVHNDEKILSLGGRLLKDLALSAPAGSRERKRFSRLSAAKYDKAYAIRGDSYPGINTATMRLIGGEPAKSAKLADVIVEKLLVGRGKAGKSAEDRYFHAATVAEAMLLLSRTADAEAALRTAIAADPKNFANHAATLRQLEIISAALALDDFWLDSHRPPPALFYCGHMIAADADAAVLKELDDRIAQALSRIRPASGFGALAAGSDIMVAEALLKRRAELHVVLPMREEDFIERSLKPFGDGWLKRFHACRVRATSFRFATFEKYLGEENVFAFGAEFAMGLAIRQAEMLRTRAEHLALWDGVDSSAPGGTAVDVRRWKASGRGQTIVQFPKELRKKKNVIDQAKGDVARTLKAMIFADIRGFSKLEETQVRAFVYEVLRPIAQQVKSLAGQPVQTATWGDGIHMVFDHVEDAAEASLQALAKCEQIDFVGHGLPDHLAIRIGAHFGPVTEVTDPFTAKQNFFGTHINIAARIEPVALPGTVYVSEPFAALLALRAPGKYRTDYVGLTELPKKFGTMRLFVLRPAAQ